MLTLGTIKTDFFKIQSIAVIGACFKEGMENHVFINLTSFFNGKTFPVNSNDDKIFSFKCFRSILEVPMTADLAIITTLSKTIPRISEQIGKKADEKSIDHIYRI